MSNMNQHYEAVIGIEVHVQLLTESKIFCTDATTFDVSDNENISPVSLGMPGTLPVLNEKVVELGAKAGLAMGCKINPKSIFARKNYFYPDLPKGYQISQYDQPLCTDGKMEFYVNSEKKIVSITRAHLEEDAGKSTHFPQYTLLNYNRAGMPLLEIVSGPDMRSADEAAEYCRQLRSLVRFIGVCDGNLEEGSLRCDCNVSVRKKGETILGTKVELKNLNSFRFIEKAIEFEIERQIDVIESGKKIVQETRLYDPDKNRTYTMRLKEDAEDYRYIADPDLQIVHFSSEKVEKILIEMPELPLKKMERYQKEFGLNANDSQLLTSEREWAEYFEKTVQLSQDAKSSSHWFLNEVLRDINDKKIKLSECKVKPGHVSDLILRVNKNEISLKMAKGIFNQLTEKEGVVQDIIKKDGLSQITDEAAIEKIIKKILTQFPEQVAEYQSGKTKVYGFLVGAVMKATQGKASPDSVNTLLKKLLENKGDS